MEACCEKVPAILGPQWISETLNILCQLAWLAAGRRHDEDLRAG
jgi:hypothetical protein